MKRLAYLVCLVALLYAGNVWGEFIDKGNPFTDNTDNPFKDEGMMTDTKTGLIWDKTPHHAANLTRSEVEYIINTMTNDAQYETNNALGVVWRLPTYDEIYGIREHILLHPIFVYNEIYEEVYWTSDPNSGIRLKKESDGSITITPVTVYAAGLWADMGPFPELIDINQTNTEEDKQPEPEIISQGQEPEDILKSDTADAEDEKTGCFIASFMDYGLSFTQFEPSYP